MHFGLYLKRQGTITSEQLVVAIEEQLHSMVPIGQLALEEGILSARDIFTILRSQSDLPNERFGDLAIELGMMSRPQLMHLLMLQADRQRPIAEILVRQGAISERECVSERANYRRNEGQLRRGVKATRVIRPPMGRGTLARMANQGISF